MARDVDKAWKKHYCFIYPTWTVHLNFHGDGWVFGGLGSEAAWCRSICNESSIIVIDVEYRLTPEFPFPVALHDCWAAVRWAHANAELLNLDPSSISAGGLSSGGRYTAVLAHFAVTVLPLGSQTAVDGSSRDRYAMCQR
ncbi:hypothetical protein EYZ11_009698 [Aspergillus tanneri]|uniref:Alpha/beta hydrolase fold-3 domain-containing protein n=1 Tax=Aspergillus tanneri TaxID=1220188 RepID=A0A4S3J794_9EURO|nr:hypothetical protein EYZ11_009698 [Aspergillus tanneri]